MNRPRPTRDEHAHAILVDRTFAERYAWNRVAERLGRFPKIAELFPLSRLREARESGPYFVHSMAWRLGLWGSDQPFEVLEDLLKLAARLPNWKAEATNLGDADFGLYWSLVWQLQVAARFVNAGLRTEWVGGRGPDLRVLVDGEPVFVECFSFRKHFDVIQFVKELCRELDRRPVDRCDSEGELKTEHDLSRPVRVPEERASFLDELFSSFLDDAYVRSMRNRAQTEWPVDHPMPAGCAGLRVVMEGPDTAYMPRLGRGTVGNEDLYLQVTLKEMVNAKRGRNHLSEHHPNAVVANLLLSEDAQLALHSVSERPSVEIPTEIDLFAVGVCAVVQRQAHFRYCYPQSREHPLLPYLAELPTS